MKRYYSYSSLFNLSKVKSLLSFGVKGYLAEIGWFEAYDNEKPVDAEGNPIPWVTYSFIDFIKPRIKSNHTVFEYGSGNSTLFYAQNGGKVVSVEHDKRWFEKISSIKPDNSQIIYCKLERNGNYCKAALNTGQRFDIIIVDGRDRVNCCKNAVNALTEQGVIVLDDSERKDYKEGIDFLLAKGFKHIPFSGISPGLFYRKSTSVFYKQDNCLDI